MEMQTKIADTRKENNYYARMCEKRIASARIFPHLGEKGEAYSQYVQGVKLNAFKVKTVQRG